MIFDLLVSGQYTQIVSTLERTVIVNQCLNRSLRSLGIGLAETAFGRRNRSRSLLVGFVNSHTLLGNLFIGIAEIRRIVEINTQAFGRCKGQRKCRPQIVIGIHRVAALASQRQRITLIVSRSVTSIGQEAGINAGNAVDIPFHKLLISRKFRSRTTPINNHARFQKLGNVHRDIGPGGKSVCKEILHDTFLALIGERRESPDSLAAAADAHVMILRES